MEFKEFEWIKNNKKKIIFFSIISILFSTIILIFKTNNFILHLVIAAFSLISYFIGYAGGLLVIGIQAINKMCPISLFDFFSKFFLYIFIFGGFLILIIIPFLSILISDSEIVFPNMSLGCFGFIYSILKVRYNFFTRGRGASSYNETVE